MHKLRPAAVGQGQGAREKKSPQIRGGSCSRLCAGAAARTGPTPSAFQQHDRGVRRGLQLERNARQAAAIDR